MSQRSSPCLIFCRGSVWAAFRLTQKASETFLKLALRPMAKEHFPLESHVHVSGLDDRLVQLLLQFIGPSGVLAWDGDQFSQDCFL